MCTKEALKEILEALDKMATRKVQRDVCLVRPDELWQLVCREVMKERQVSTAPTPRKMPTSNSMAPRDVTKAINAIMKAHTNPHEVSQQHIWEEELYGNKDFYDDVTGKDLSHEPTVVARCMHFKLLGACSVCG